MKRSCIKLLSFVFVFIFTLSMVPFDAISDMFGHVLPIASANMAQTENQNKTKKSDDMIPIYSVPKQVTTTYFIVYNANGGTGAPGKQIKSENQDIIIPDQQPIKTGWTFIGWGYSSSSDSVAYKPGATYSENKSRTLYALYRPNFFGDVNGDGVADLTDIEIINKFRRNIIELTNRQQIAADVNLSGEIDIQDMVCINNYRLNYVDRLPADLLAEVSFIPPTKRIYKLNEELDTSGAAVQFTNKDNPEVSYSLNDDLVFSGFDSSSAEKKNMTVLFEVWSDTFEIDVRSPYLLTYNASGGTGAPSSQSFYSGESVILSKKIPTKNGYAFIGWADSANAVIINYFGGNEYYFSGNKTLYAVWTIFGDIDADGKISDSDLLRVSRYAAGLDTSLSEYQKICADVNGDRKITSEDSDIISQYLVQSIKGFPIHERKIQLCVASDVKKQYNIGENLILGEQVFLQYPGNACLPVSGYKVSGYDKTKPGKQTVTVTFGVWSATYEVEVIASSESYTLSFDALGGSGAPEPMTGAVTYTIPATVPTRFGNIFQGWQFLNSSGQYIYYHPGEKITLTKDTILNASWGGSSFSGSGRTLSAYIDDPGETYYEGYTPDASGKYVLYVTDSVDARVWLYDSNGNQLAECKKCNDSRAFRLEYTLTKGEKYFYVFRYNSNTAKGNISYTFGPVYTIAFNATGGKAEPDPQTKDWGWDTEINSDKPSKAFSLSFDANGGFISPSSVTYLCPFNNWNTKPDGSGTAYDPGDEYTDDADVTLYAQWENPIAGELEKPTREGYLFDGWYTAEDGGEEITEDFEVSGDITTYARWVEEPDEFTVSYDANGGEAAPEDQIKTEGRDLTLSEEIPVKVYTISYDSTGGSTEDDSKTVDCIFRYWDSEPDGTGREYDPGDEYTDDADITLYAQWENPVAGELEKPTRVGYLFDGWYTAEDGGEKITEDFEISGDITAYARWVEETDEFTVSFDANGGDEAPEDQIKIEGTDLTLSEKIPEKKYVITYDSTGGRTENEEKTVDCTFIDWNSKPDGSGTVYAPGVEYSDDADVTLYAQWKNPVAGVLEDPIRDGYVFDGWYTAEDGGEEITESFEVTEDIMVYAHWVAEENSIFLAGDINGDGVVNNKDLTRLMKYLSGEDVYVVEKALDVNGDGSCNNKDLTRLMKYLAGEDVKIYYDKNAGESEKMYYVPVSISTQSEAGTNEQALWQWGESDVSVSLKDEKSPERVRSILFDDDGRLLSATGTDTVFEIECGVQYEFKYNDAVLDSVVRTKEPLQQMDNAADYITTSTLLFNENGLLSKYTTEEDTSFSDFSIEYDEIGRVVSISGGDSGGSFAITYSYSNDRYDSADDSQSGVSEYYYNGEGKLIQVDGEDGYIEYEYDEHGNVIRIIDDIYASEIQIRYEQATYAQYQAFLAIMNCNLDFVTPNEKISSFYRGFLMN